MLKYIYRTLILLGVFIASLFYFSRDIKEVTFDVDNTIEMSEATFPIVTIGRGEDVINLLHGYSSNLNANTIRESVTPLDEDQELEVIIQQEDYIIKKLNYELREPVGNRLVESDSVSVFSQDGDKLRAKIRLKEELEIEKEYALKITLITSESKKMYYYNRLKRFNNVYLHECLSYVKDFHNATQDKEKANDIIRYLEPDERKADNTSLSHVNIHSSFDLITWGDLQPEFITEVVPSIVEIHWDVAYIVLDYFVQANIAGKVELYKVKEFYRVRYSPSRMFLLNYERTMEAVFDASLASISQNELKLGISSQDQVPFLVSSDNMKLAFVRNRELWFYNMEDNEMVRVFSFVQEERDYIRDFYDQHDLSLLNISEEGNIDFIVYGYMNRGYYEGRVGIILYQYIRADNRIEEKVFIPVDQSYGKLKENLGDLIYVNDLDVFYFHIYNNIYAYDQITQELLILEENVPKDRIVIFEEINYAVWQADSVPKLSNEIKIMDLESGEIQEITSKLGYKIRLLDKIDENIIYGYVSKDDIKTLLDGRVVFPLGLIEIASIDKEILKDYNKEDYYISHISVQDNIIELNLIEKEYDNGGLTFSEAGQDYIMNQQIDKSLAVEVTSRITDKALTELYLKLPRGYNMEKTPLIRSTVNTVITEDPTLRLSLPSHEPVYYYPYLYDGVRGAYSEAYEAIEIARDHVGVVFDGDDRIIWERGVTPNRYVIDDIDKMSWNQTPNRTVETCIKLMLDYLGTNVNIEDLLVDGRSIMEVLSDYSHISPIRLTGTSLDDVLYFIGKEKPIIAIKDKQEAVLIYGYDAYNIMVIDPSSGSTSRLGLRQASELFEASGNVFISYLEAIR